MRLITTILLSLLIMPAPAQSITDTTFTINSVTVTGTRQHVNRIVGSKMSTIAPTVLKSNQTRNMAEILTDHSLVHIKSMGQGGLSTSSFRGTGANHTQVNWNGININSSMMGNFDFSQFPSFFTDQVTLNHGSSDTRSGTGALGGSINLNNRLGATDTTGITAFVEGASYQTWSAAASTIYGNSTIRARTRIFGQISDNNFKYVNKVLQKNPFEERRKSAEYHQAGLMQEFYRTLSSGTEMSSIFWINKYRRNLPQPVMVNRIKNESENMANIKWFNEYKSVTSQRTLSFKGAWLMDYYFYRSEFDQYNFTNNNSENWANAAILKSDYNTKLNDNMTLMAAANYRLDVVKAGNYAKNHVSRHTVSIMGRTEWQASETTRLSIQAMAEQNDQLLMPTFAAGVEHQLIPVLLTISANVARNYHSPTLNDLHWSRLGNPNLKPEKGMAYDATLRLNLPGNIIRHRTEATAYLMEVSDWIIWMRKPGGGFSDWTPSNLKRVRSQGVEVMTETSARTGQIGHTLNINYGWTRSQSIQREFEGDRSYKKQIPYVPQHKANLRYRISNNRYHISYGIAYTGVRYITTDHSFSTTDYATHDIEAGCRMNGWLSFRARINNLLDTYYESTQYFPMPLRNYGLAMVIDI